MAYRKLKLEEINEVWEYVIGKEGVKMRSPEGKCTWKRKYEIHGYTKEQHLDNLHDYYDHCADCYGPDLYETGPGDVKRYILENLKD